MLVLGADAEHYTRGRVCSPEFFVFRGTFESLNYHHSTTNCGHAAGIAADL
jgi:hypothetical protein